MTGQIDASVVSSAPAAGGALTEAPSHLELLNGARTLQRLALGPDVTAIDRELRAFRRALSDHLNSEEPALADLPATAKGLIGRGQQRLLQDIDRLLGVVANDGGDLTHLVHLTRQLRAQARLEERLLCAHATTPPA